MAGGAHNVEAHNAIHARAKEERAGLPHPPCYSGTGPSRRLMQSRALGEAAPPGGRDHSGSRSPYKSRPVSPQSQLYPGLQHRRKRAGASVAPSVVGAHSLRPGHGGWRPVPRGMGGTPPDGARRPYFEVDQGRRLSGWLRTPERAERPHPAGIHPSIPRHSHEPTPEGGPLAVPFCIRARARTSLPDSGRETQTQH